MTMIEPDAVAARPNKWTPIWDTVRAVFGAIMGLAPHVLHHVGLIAGAALLTGTVGNFLFFAVGLALSTPLLRRLYRRFNTWRAPAIAIAVFTVMFSVSAFVIGPAIAGSSPSEQPPTAPSQTPTDSHSGHHPG